MSFEYTIWKEFELKAESNDFVFDGELRLLKTFNINFEA